MKIISICGNRDGLKFETDEGIFFGYGEMLVHGFLIFDDGLADSSDEPVSGDVREQIITATREYLHNSPDPLPIYFE